MAEKISFDEIEEVSNVSIAKAAKSKGGRKRVNRELINQKLVVYVTKEEHEKLMSHCEETGIPVSTFIRKNIMKVINKPK